MQKKTDSNPSPYEPFEYGIFRFCPDLLNGEFLNVGVVVYSSIQKRVLLRLTDNASRLTQAFGIALTRDCASLLRGIRNDFALLNESTQIKFENLSSLLRYLYPDESIAFVRWDYHTLSTNNLEESLDQLYEAYVGEPERLAEPESTSPAFATDEAAGESHQRRRASHWQP